VVADAVKAREIQDHVKQQSAPYKYPRDVQFRPSLPRNSSGRRQHHVLRNSFREEASTLASSR
jgi:2-aminobenzoate-CoA ligase